MNLATLHMPATNIPKPRKHGLGVGGRAFSPGKSLPADAQDAHVKTISQGNRPPIGN